MYTGSSDREVPKASAGVIVIACLVGSLIVGVCILGIVCIIRTSKKKDEEERLPEEDSEERRRRAIREKIN